MAKELLRRKGLKIWDKLETKGLNVYLRSRAETPKWEVLTTGRTFTLLTLDEPQTFHAKCYSKLEEPFFLLRGITDEGKEQIWVFAMLQEAATPLFNTQYWSNWDFPSREEILRQQLNKQY